MKYVSLVALALLILGAGCTSANETTSGYSTDDVVQEPVIEEPTPEPMPDNTLPEERVSLADFSAPPTSLPGVLVDEELLDKTVRVTTSKGVIDLELRGDVAPWTVSNFLILAHTGFYDGLTFHRFEPGFVIQGGDPDGNGTGGPGYTVPAEINTQILHEKYALATARQGDQVNPERRSSGSQFYITLDATPFLDGAYTTFGNVTAGQDVVESLRAEDTIVSMEIL